MDGVENYKVERSCEIPVLEVCQILPLLKNGAVIRVHHLENKPNEYSVWALSIGEYKCISYTDNSKSVLQDYYSFTSNKNEFINMLKESCKVSYISRRGKMFECHIEK